MDTYPISFLRPSDLPHSARLLLWGTGGACMSVLEGIRGGRDDLEVVGFVETAPETPSKLGKTVWSADKLGSLAGTFDLLVIASHWWQDISRQLLNRGYRDFIVALPPPRQGEWVREVLVIPELQWIYVINEKVASNSIASAMIDLLCESHPERAAHLHELGSVKRLTTVDLSANEYRGYFKFTFVRNPWDRVVSCYENKFNNPAFIELYPEAPLYLGQANAAARFLGTSRISFEQFVSYLYLEPNVFADKHWDNQSERVCTCSGEQIVDFVGRFETLEEACKTIRDMTGRSLTLPRLGASSRHQDYRAYYNSATRRAVEERYRQDIELFGYAFE